MSHTKTFQYSVKENIRPIGKYKRQFRLAFTIKANKNHSFILSFIDHGKGSHGIPGLYFKYDVSALKVIVKQDHESFVSFLIRISSVIAGIIVISGYLNSFIQLMCDTLIKTVSPETYKQLHNPNQTTFIAATPQQSSQHQPNNLISNANQMAEVKFDFTVKQ